MVRILSLISALLGWPVVSRLQQQRRRRRLQCAGTGCGGGAAGRRTTGPHRPPARAALRAVPIVKQCLSNQLSVGPSPVICVWMRG